jgi:hypothetical protein
MRYMHHLHKTLDEIRIGEKVLLVHQPNPHPHVTTCICTSRKGVNAAP